ncbi:MAG: dihydroorotate dehydrogenase-like protein [Candidatus Cloacimonadales bacterium]
MKLNTTYLGLDLKNPLIVGASPLTSDIASIKKLEAAGAAAIVIKSLFEEEIQLQRFVREEESSKYNNLNPEMITIFPEMKHAGPKEHLYWVKKAKEAVSIPVIASLNAVNRETWLQYAKLLEETGVDALELNFFYTPKSFQQTGAEIEAEQLQIMRELKAEVKIPIAVKLSSFYSNPLNFIHKIDQLGLEGVVIFNRMFQPDINLESGKNIFPYNLSSSQDNRLALRYSGLLSGQIKSDICANTGIKQGEDLIKMILAGAGAVQIVSTIYQNGFAVIGEMLQELENWMQKNHYETLADFQGSMNKQNNPDPWVYTRAQYVRLMMNPEKIIKSNEI